ncbi:thiosulfate/3-mercaptopyruvate sulfurtransferase [Bradyrhizobium sp. USDA 4369]
MTIPNDPLVSTDWLAAHLGDPRVKVLDATFKLPGVLPLPKDDYLKGHIPGAVFFDVDEVSDHANPLPHMYPSAEQFGRDAARLGVSNGDIVVVYDAGGWVAAPRAWWMFLSFGHADVRVLDGGLKKWTAEGRPIDSGQVTPTLGTYGAHFDAARVRKIEQMVANLAERAEQVIDARPAPRFAGAVAEPRPGLRSGHIPGSRNLPYCRAVRRGHRRDEAARPVAERFRCGRGGPGEADRHIVRLRRVGRRADLGAVPSGHPRHRALRRILV